MLMHSSRAPGFSHLRTPMSVLKEGSCKPVKTVEAIRFSEDGATNATASFGSVNLADALTTIKDAGLAGIASYFVVEVTFFAIALPIGYVGYYAATGEWLSLLDCLQNGEGRIRILGLLFSYVVLLKTLFPLRLGSTLLLTPRMRAILRRII
eukprot:6202898-Pleurochrysis_carterae.AAC.4